MDRSFALRLPRPAVISLPRARRPLLWAAVALLALPGLGGAWLWLRDSSLVSVEHVHISGVRAPEGRAIRVALDEAARRMSTLHVKLSALRAAVAPFRVVRDIRASGSFPHTLNVSVIERPPVAALTLGGIKTAAAADGVLLGPGLLSGSLPRISGSSRESAATEQVRSPATLAALNVLGAAPPTLEGWVARVFSGKEGLTVAMRNGLLLYFGDASRARAKWLSAARVLADPSSKGAWYVDVRLPERPAAGLGETAFEAAEAPSSATQVSASDPTAASLAASLAEAVSGAAAQTPSASAQSATPTSASSSPAAPVEKTPSVATENAPPTGAESPTPTQSAPSEEVSSSTGG